MLPLRQGVGPSTVALPSGHRDRWPTLADYLAHRFAAVPREEWIARMQRGEVVDAQGQPVAADHPFEPQQRYHYYREWPDEPHVPFDESVVFEDEFLLVADKPHFLPVTPKGKHVRETLLARLRDRTGNAELSPIHRIDRETAGLVVFAKQRTTRHAYQQLFAQSQVHKVYEAIVHQSSDPQGRAWADALRVAAVTRRSRLEPSTHFMQMHESGKADDIPNAETRIHLLEARADFLRLRLEPRTGKRHQLRVHLMALGLPIVGDRIYPVLRPEGSDEYQHPLRLLASSIAFDDPLTGQRRSFASSLALAWPDTGAASAPLG